MEFELYQLIIMSVAAMFIGIGKAGLPGAGMLTIPIFASIIGSKPSTGYLLPLLIVADIVAVYHYRKNVHWKYLFRLFPFVVIGIIVAMLVGNSIDDKQFKWLLAAVILLGVVIMIWRDIKKSELVIADKKYFFTSMGFLGGFTSMIANGAGPVMSLYLMGAKLPKDNFIGTRAWFFFIMNLVKIPIHVYVWKTISFGSLGSNLYLVPSIFIGMFIGFKILKRIPEHIFKYVVIVAVVASAVSMLVSF